VKSACNVFLLAAHQRWASDGTLRTLGEQADFKHCLCHGAGVAKISRFSVERAGRGVIFTRLA